MSALRTPASVHLSRGIDLVLLNDGREVHLDDISTVAEAESVLSDVTGAIVAMEAQIEMAKVSDRPPEPDWYRRLNVALGRKRYQRPRLQRRADQLRKAERLASLPEGATSRKDAKRQAFISAAEAMLEHEVFTEIWARARELHPAAFGESSGEVRP